MAKKTITLLECDICGAEASESAVVNGYSMDLCVSHSKPLEAYKGVGVRVSAKSGSKAPQKANSGQLAEVRAWGQANGYKVGDRGRISQDVWDAFNKANEA